MSVTAYSFILAKQEKSGFPWYDPFKMSKTASECLVVIYYHSLHFSVLSCKLSYVYCKSVNVLLQSIVTQLIRAEGVK